MRRARSGSTSARVGTGRQPSQCTGPLVSVSRMMRLGLIAAGLVGLGDEDDADGEPVFRLEIPGLIEAELLRLLLEEGLRNLADQPGPVAGVAADAAAVLDGLQAQDGLLDDLVRLALPSRAATPPMPQASCPMSSRYR